MSTSEALPPLFDVATNDTVAAEPSVPGQPHMIEKIFFPIVIIMGTVCNILIFMVMRRKKMRHQSTYFYMAVLAVDDQLVLIMGCLNYWLYLLDILNSMKNFVLCKLISFMCYSSLHFSVWIVVIMTCERFIAVALPLQASRLCTVKRAKMVTLLLVFIVICVNSHFIFTHAVEKTNSTTGAEEYHCQPTKQYDTFIRHVWPWIDASIYSIAPLIILIIFNTLIVHNLVKASKSISKLNHGTGNSINSRSSDNANDQRRRVSTAPTSNLKTKKNSCDLGDYRVSSFVSSVCCFCCLRVESLRSRRRSRQDTGGDDDGGGGGGADPKRSSDMYLTAKPPSYSTEHAKYKYKFKSSRSSLESGALVIGLNGQVVKHPATADRKQSLPSNAMSRATANANGNNTRAVNSSASQSSSANRRLTIMLLVVSTAFFITSTPIVTLQMIDMSDLAPKSDHLLTIRGIFLVLQYLNHSINFFLYAVTGKTFRREFIALFKSLRRSSNANAGKGNNAKQRDNSLKNNSHAPAAKRLPHSLSNTSPNGFNNLALPATPNSQALSPLRKNGPYLMVASSSIDEEDSNNSKSTLTRTASQSDKPS